MDALPPLVTTLPSLDEAESALDWIGVPFVEGDHTFEGELEAEDAELLDTTIADADSPDAVRALARSLRALLGDADGPVPWRVGFDA